MAILTSRYAIFNGWNFNNVTGLSVYSLPKPANSLNSSTGNGRTTNIFALARRSARKVSSAFQQQNTIPVGVYITTGSLEQLEQAIETLVANIMLIEGTLQMPQAGVLRQVTGTFTNYKVNDSAGGYADITLYFEASDSYFYDTTAQTLYNVTNQTSSVNNYPFTQGGSADTQVPVIQVQFNTTPTGNPGTLIIGNNNNGQAVSITRTFSQYDLVVVDSKNKSVQVNGADVDYTGAIPEFGLGSQSFYVQDTFTVRNYRTIGQVQNRYN